MDTILGVCANSLKALYYTLGIFFTAHTHNGSVQQRLCMLLYKKTPTLSIYYSYELYAALALWQGSMSGHDFQESADLIESVLREYSTGKLVTYSIPMRVIDRKTTRYITDEWLPRIAGTVLHYWADVVPRLSNEAPQDINDITEIHAIEGITIAQFGNIETAKKWIQTK